MGCDKSDDGTINLQKMLIKNLFYQNWKSESITSPAAVSIKPKNWWNLPESREKHLLLLCGCSHYLLTLLLHCILSGGLAVMPFPLFLSCETNSAACLLDYYICFRFGLGFCLLKSCHRLCEKFGITNIRNRKKFRLPRAKVKIKRLQSVARGIRSLITFSARAAKINRPNTS